MKGSIINSQQRIGIANSAAGAAASISLGLTYLGLFLVYCKNSAGTVITGVGANILFPVMILAVAVDAALSLAIAHLDRRRKDDRLKNRHVVNAVVSSLTFAALSVAIIGAMAAAATFALATPIIFMAVNGCKAIFNAAAAIYYAGKSAAIKMDDLNDEKNLSRKEKYRARAKSHAKSAGLDLISFAATTAVFLLGYFVFAPVGIAVNAIYLALCFIGIGLGIKHFADQRKAAAQVPVHSPAAEVHVKKPSLTPEAARKLGIRQKASVINTHSKKMEKHDGRCGTSRMGIFKNPQRGQATALSHGMSAGYRP